MLGNTANGHDAQIQDRLSIAVYGPVTTTTGFGTATRACIYSLRSAGAALSVVDTSPGGTVHDPVIAGLLNRTMLPDIHLFFGYPMAAIPLRLFYSKVVAQIAWETEQLPSEWVCVLDDIAEIWTPSEWGVQVVRRSTATTTRLWPYPVDPQRSLTPQFPAELSGIPDDVFVFYSIFGWQERKNPLGLIEAYLRAFNSNSRTLLVLKTFLHPRFASAAVAEVSKLRQYLRSDAEVLICTERWTPEEVAALERRGDCCISLHRGEGWCYPLFNAACNGTPVIATCYGGPTEYLCAAEHYLVEHRQTTVSEPFHFLRPGMDWVDPDIDRASLFMRHVVENRDEARRRAQRGAERLLDTYSHAACGKRALQWLASLAGTR